MNEAGGYVLYTGGYLRMKDSEIIRRWKNRGLPDYAMVKCLAELNACDMHLILDKLKELGLFDEENTRECLSTTGFRHYSKREIKILIDMLEQGCHPEEIGKKLYRSRQSVVSQITRLKKKGVIT